MLEKIRQITKTMYYVYYVSDDPIVGPLFFSYITKTRLFKYIENVTTPQKMKVFRQKFW